MKGEGGRELGGGRVRVTVSEPARGTALAAHSSPASRLTVHSSPFTFHFLTHTLPARRMSRDDRPTITRKLPGSTTHRIAALSIRSC